MKRIIDTGIMLLLDDIQGSFFFFFCSSTEKSQIVFTFVPVLDIANQQFAEIIVTFKAAFYLF